MFHPQRWDAADLAEWLTLVGHSEVAATAVVEQDIHGAKFAEIITSKNTARFESLRIESKVR